MMGAAPVPVPPPSPAVTNTMSASASASRISARLSSAAWHPTSGFAPAPRPRVSSSPMWIVLSASDMSSAWRSVLTAMNSTPFTPASTMRFTAFVPPPPTPTTLMTAKCSEPILFGIVSSTPAAFSNAAFPFGGTVHVGISCTMSMQLQITLRQWMLRVHEYARLTTARGFMPRKRPLRLWQRAQQQGALRQQRTAWQANA